MSIKALVLGFLVTIGSSADPGLSPQEQSRARAAFLVAQATEARALAHRQGLERQDRKASEETQRRVFQDRQRADFTRFFAENRDPRARREFQIQQENEQKAFEGTQREQGLAREQDWARQTQEMQARHREHLRLAEAALSSGKKPDPHLWPPRGI